MQSRRSMAVLAAVLTAGLAAALMLVPGRLETGSLPERYSSQEFWNLITELSEPDGYFRSDNFVSNETSFQHVIPELRRRTKPGGVYLGVGPDQNFTYIVAMEPHVAFIIDIRRQNLLQHLMYKALFEISETRAEFLANLFARPLDGVDEPATPEQLFAALEARPASRSMYQAMRATILDRLRNRHGFPLSDEDQEGIDYVYRAFYSAGPDIRYSYPSQSGWRRFPSYSDLMLETDLEDVNRSYLASEENYQFVRKLQADNRIIPIVGDFAGPHALRRLGAYLQAHGATVAAFYLSNVEFYLFQSDVWDEFIRNVETLPVDASSTLIRSDFGNFRTLFPRFGRSPTLQSRSLLDNISDLIEDFNNGRIRTYDDAIWRSDEP